MRDTQTIPRYELGELLGSGAYADVFKAVDTSLKRTVALKLLKPNLIGDPESFGRFRLEAQVAANLIHPRIAWVWDMGHMMDGRYYIAMRYVDGSSLDKILKQKGTLSWAEAYSILRQVAEGLSHAHAQGLVHRDVKPQNILVGPKEGAVLTDFGLVRAVEITGSISFSNAFIGTPQYIPPEVWDGIPASPAADQYALAAVLVQMLAGKSPFDALTPLAVMKKHILPVELPATWPDGAPKQLNEVLQKALAKDPRERYVDIEAFIQAMAENEPKAESPQKGPDKPQDQPDLESPEEKKDENYDEPVEDPGEQKPADGKNRAGEDDTAGLTRQPFFASQESVHILNLNILHYDSYTVIGHTPGQVNIPAGTSWLLRVEDPTAVGLKTILKEALKAPSGLASLVLKKGKKVTDDSLIGLGALDELTSLELEDIEQVTTSGFKFLRTLPNLLLLKITGVKDLNDDFFSCFAQPLKLKSLEISSCRALSGSGLKALSKFTNLTDLNLYNSLGDLPGLDLAPLSSLKKLKRLGLGGNQFDERGLQYLIGLPQLSTLDLGSSFRLTDTGLSYIKSMTNLQELNIASCRKITDRGFASLSSLTDLKILDITYCNVTDKGLMSLWGMKKLSRLSIFGCKKITAIGRAGLKMAIKNVDLFG